MNSSPEIQAILQRNQEAHQEQIATQNKLISQLQQQATAQDKAYKDLLTKFEHVAVQQLRSQDPISSQKKKGKTRAASRPTPNKSHSTSNTAKPTTAPQSEKRKPTSSSAKGPSKATINTSTPAKQTAKPAGPRQSGSRVKAAGPAPAKASPRRHPSQVVGTDWPEGFEPTKACLFIFIRIIWGMVLACAVPKPPNPDLVAEFNSRFSDVSEIQGALDSPNAKDLVDKKEVITLAEARLGRMKIGKGIVNIKEFFTLYAVAMFAKIGIRVWAPDLDAADDSLWNEACRISAIRIFRQWAAADAFAYMNINKRFINDILLLERAYNHYVHYWMAQRYKREQKEEGKNQADDEKKNVQRSRQRLRDSRCKRSVTHNFPKRYQKMLSQVEAHSDDEYDSKRNAYIVKTPVYRSLAAGKMIRRLDDHMLKDLQLAGKRTKHRLRLRPKRAIPSLLVKPPKGLPIDFYDADWFNDAIDAGQRRDLADTDNVMFLPQPELSLLGKAHPDEKLSDKKFTEKYWAKNSEAYDMDQNIEAQDEEEETDEDDSSYDGGSIDLDDTDGEDDSDADEFEVEDEDEDDDFEGEEEEYNEDDDEMTFEDAVGGKGLMFLQDEQMVDEDDDARALRYDAWADA